MEFTISIEKAKKALEASSVVLSTNTQIQEVLKNYLIQATDGDVLILGTDLEIAMLAHQSCDVKETGTVLVDGKKLSDIIRYASGETLHFKTDDDGKLNIRHQTGKWTLLTRAADEFPQVEDFDEEKEFKTISRAQFVQALQRVSHSVCEDETRRALNAVSIKDNQFMSTDGKMVTVFVPPVKIDICDTLIPQRSLTPLVRVLNRFEDETFKFQDSKAFYYFKIGGNTFSIRKVNIEFPAKRTLQILESAKASNTVEVKFNRAAIVSAIERVRLNAQQDSKAIYLGITNGVTTIKTVDEFGNYSIETLKSELKDSNEKVSKVEIFFNWVNLFEVLKAMTSEVVVMKFDTNYNKKPLYIGELSLDSILLPIEMSFNQEDLK